MIIPKLPNCSFKYRFNCKICSCEHEQGRGGLYLLAYNLTQKFELQYQGAEWGSNDYLCYFDRLDEFLENELK